MPTALSGWPAANSVCVFVGQHLMAAGNHSSVGLQSHVATVFADGCWYADDNPRTFVRFAEGMCLPMVHHGKLLA
jgi:hypothetical protein